MLFNKGVNVKINNYLCVLFLFYNPKDLTLYSAVVVVGPKTLTLFESKSKAKTKITNK